MLELSTRFPSQSRVLHRRDGYREVALLWHEFHRSRDPVFERVEHAIDLRDIATLNELGLLFELIDRISFQTGIKPRLIKAFDHFGHPTGSFEARFPGVVRLFYQRGFAAPYVYSGIRLYPDYVWERADGKRIVMDAEIRMQHPWQREGDGMTPNLDRSRAKTDDFTKMHAYRNAIDGV